jgi:hypothetical protein
MAFPLQDTTCDQTAGQMRLLRPLRPRLTTSQPELILADADHFLDVRVTTPKTIDLVVQTQVYKLKRARRTRSRA